MTATLASRGARVAAGARVGAGRSRYLLAAICVAICTVMLTPLLISVLASLKPTAEAAASPPTYLPHAISLDSYERLWSYQQGLPTYLGNSLGAALLTIALTLALTVPAAYALARFPVPGKEVLFVVLLLALIVPYQALLTPIFLMFARIKLTNALLGLGSCTPRSSSRSASTSCATASAPSRASWRRRRSSTGRRRGSS